MNGKDSYLEWIYGEKFPIYKENPFEIECS